MKGSRGGDLDKKRRICGRHGFIDGNNLVFSAGVPDGDHLHGPSIST